MPSTLAEYGESKYVTNTKNLMKWCVSKGQEECARGEMRRKALPAGTPECCTSTPRFRDRRTNGLWAFLNLLWTLMPGLISRKEGQKKKMLVSAGDGVP